MFDIWSTPEHRNDPRVVRCLTCNWFEVSDKAPLRAHVRGSKHARRKACHEVVVINLEMLVVEERYLHDRLPDVGEDAPF